MGRSIINSSLHSNSTVSRALQLLCQQSALCYYHCTSSYYIDRRISTAWSVKMLTAVTMVTVRSLQPSFIFHLSSSSFSVFYSVIITSAHHTSRIDSQLLVIHSTQMRCRVVSVSISWLMAFVAPKNHYDAAKGDGEKASCKESCGFCTEGYRFDEIYSEGDSRRESIFII